MIPVLEGPTDTFTRLHGSEILLRLDGVAKAPLDTILDASWSEADRAAYGVFLVAPFAVPDGKIAVGSPTYSRVGGVVVETYAVSDPPPPTAEEVRVQTFKDDVDVADLISRLETASLAQIDSWLQSNVNNLAQARTVLGYVIKALAIVWFRQRGM